MLPLVTALCLLALASASPIVNADPKPCCIPEVFEGNISITGIQDLGHHVSAEFAAATVHFDLKNKRIAQKQMHLVDGKVLQVNLVERESDNTTYIFYPASKHCYKFPAQKITNCISPELKYTIGLKLGINPALDVDVYTLAVTNRTFTYINLSVTKTDCVPIGQTIVRALSREVWGSQTESFYDLAIGIKDTSVFDVPSYCQKVAMRPLSGLTQKAHTAYYHRRAPFL